MDAFDARALYDALDTRRRLRRKRRLSWQQVADRAGLANRCPIDRIRQGRSISVHNLALLLAWHGDTSLRPYIRTTPKESR